MINLSEIEVFCPSYGSLSLIGLSGVLRRIRSGANEILILLNSLIPSHVGNSLFNFSRPDPSILTEGILGLVLGIKIIDGKSLPCPLFSYLLKFFFGI